MKKHLILIGLFTVFSCQTQKQPTMKFPKTYKYTNDLIHESSPYLLQHAHNPVHWHPWGNKALKKAQKNNKLLIISIGYAACHWCHVMEHESFEDTVVAKLMNTYYVPVKVDREEHPDVDKIYMSAVQQLIGRGGWPLNVVALPDGRPVWGGTYFPKNNWMQALKQIAEMWQNTPEKLYKVADQLAQGIKAAEIVHPNTAQKSFDVSTIKKALNFWKQYKDDKYGGFNRAPKFPMPAQYRFLLRAGYQLDDKDIENFVKLTLDKMAQGGIYDHINGGFSRYSTDKKWHIPHFEKMLYDNAQLVSLYTDVYKLYHQPAYKQVVIQTLQFVENELTDTTGVFYSSLDADSDNAEGHLEEGAYYVFTKPELQKAIGEDFPLFKEYYNINAYGLWEEGKYHLIKKMNDEEFVKQYNISLKDLQKKVTEWRKKLYNIRQQRPRPLLDDKTLTSWNALMLNGFIDAYKTFDDMHYLEVARRNADFILKQQLRPDGSLYHSYKKGRSSIDGYLEDYAFLIKALINLYEATGIEKYLLKAKDLNQYVLDNFYDTSSGMFYFTGSYQKGLLTRPMEVDDNVIPSSNAIMAENMFKLGHYFEKQDYMERSRQMLHNILPKIDRYAPGYYQWLNNMLDQIDSYYEIAITGKQAEQKSKELLHYYIPNKISAFSITPSDLPLLKDRHVSDQTYIYLCVDNTCQLPVTDVKEIVKKIK